MTPDERSEERRRKHEEAIDAHIKRMVAEAPPLTHEQRTRLAELLRPVRRHARIDTG